MTRLSDIVKIGDIVATTNVIGYEGVELAVYLGIDFSGRNDELLLINWLNSPRALEKVFRSDFNRYFVPVKLIGLTRQRRIIFKRIRRKFNVAGPEISGATGKPIIKVLKKIV